MSEVGITIDVSATVAGLTALQNKLDGVMKDIVANALHEVQVMASAHAPVGEPGNSTNPPGDLKRHISKEGPEGGNGVYAGRVGPTIVYGRQRALGGDIYPKRATYLTFTTFGLTYNVAHVYQHPHPYMHPGRNDALPLIWTMANEKIAAAITGS